MVSYPQRKRDAIAPEAKSAGGNRGEKQKRVDTKIEK